MTLGGAGRRNFLENPRRELFYEVEIEIIGRSVGRERGEPDSDLGGLLCELIHLSVSCQTAARSRPMAIVAAVCGPEQMFFG